MRSIRTAAVLPTCCALLAPVVVAGLSGDPPQDYACELSSNRRVIAPFRQSINRYRHTKVERQIANDPVDIRFLDDDHPIERQLVSVRLILRKQMSSAFEGRAFQRPVESGGKGKFLVRQSCPLHQIAKPKLRDKPGHSPGY